MKNKTHTFKSHCPINYAQEVFGDRWSLLIIRDLMFKGKAHYGEFLNSEEKISTNILASRLEKLEGHGLIDKTEDDNHKAKLIYSLTEKGVDLMPILLATIRWSAKYDDKTLAPKEFVCRLEQDSLALEQELRAKLEG